MTCKDKKVDDKKVMLKKCLFPVAGYGTRFLPATKSMPKEMLPIVNKPLVQYGVEEAYAAGLTDIGFVTGRGKRAIEDHFDVSYELEHQIAGTGKEKMLEGIRELIDHCTFSYTRQVKMAGLGDAILAGRTVVGDEPFAVVLADDLCMGPDGGVLAQMVKLFRQFRCSIVAIEEVPRNETNKYGVISGEEISEALVESIIRERLGDQGYGQATMQDVISGVCSIFAVSQEEIVGQSRRKNIAEARQVAAYLAREVLDMPLNAIGLHLGGRDHTTVMHSHKKVTELLKKDDKFKRRVDIIYNELNLN